jgi:hypothetical protein
MNTDITVLDHLMALNLDVNIWTARKKLTPADFGGAELPPEDLASLGSKKIWVPRRSLWISHEASSSLMGAPIR